MTKYDEMSNMTKCRNIESKVVKFGEIGRSGEIGHFDEIVIKFKFNAMKLIENKSVVLSWVYLQPFCSTFFTFFTLFSIFNLIFFFGSYERTSALVKRLKLSFYLTFETFIFVLIDSLQSNWITLDPIHIFM